MEEMIKDRNEAFGSGNIEKIKAYCEKYNVSIPEDENIFLAGIHKTICNLFLSEDNVITVEQYQKSFNWLITNGFTPII